MTVEGEKTWRCWKQGSIVIGWNKLERYEAAPATIMKLEGREGFVFWVFEVPVVELCVLRLFE